MSHVSKNRALRCARPAATAAPRAALRPLLMAMGLAGLVSVVAPVHAQSQSVSASEGMPTLELVRGTVNAQTSTVSVIEGSTYTNPNAAVSTSINGRDYTTITINQTSDKAIWQGENFNIGALQAFVNNGPSAQSQTLIHAIGGSPSNILGVVKANNQLMLVNKAGIYVGSGGQVSGAAVMLSAMDLVANSQTGYTNSYDRFIAGEALRLTMEGAVFNDFHVSHVEVGSGGQVTGEQGVLMVAPNYVGNSGTVRTSATQGSKIVMMAAHDATVQLGDSGFIELAPLSETVAQNPNSVVRVVENIGTIQADGGQISLIEAGAGNDTFFLTTGEQQRQYGSSSAGIYNAEPGIIRARSADGRSAILLQTIGQRGQLSNWGTIDADGLGSTSGVGGSITLLGRDLYVTGALTANGANGGGQIDLINNNTVSNITTVSASARVSADATVTGNGGTLRVLSAPNVSDDTQTSYVNRLDGVDGEATLLGSWSAKGAGGGQGGKFISSGVANYLWQATEGGTLFADIDLSAGVGGRNGQFSYWAPKVYVGNQTDITNTLNNQQFWQVGTMRDEDINRLLDRGSDVKVATYVDSEAGSDNVNNRIEVLDGTNILSTWSGSQSLTLSSSGNVDVHGASGDATRIRGTGGALNIKIKSDSDGDGTGDINIYEAFSSFTAARNTDRVSAQAVAANEAPVTVRSNGGRIEIEGSTAPQGRSVSGTSVRVNGTELDAGTGTVDIRGEQHQSWGTDVVTNVPRFSRGGVAITNSRIAAREVNIQGRGNNRDGVYIDSTDLFISNGLLAITGLAVHANSFNEGFVSGVSLGTVGVTLQSSRMAVRGFGSGVDFNPAVGVTVGALDVTATGTKTSQPAVDIVGSSTGTSYEGLFVTGGINLHGAGGNDVVTDADVLIGASADADRAFTAMLLGSSRFNTTGRIGVRPALFDGINVVEQVAKPIFVGSPRDEALDTNFIVPGALFDGGKGTGYSVIVGSSLHVGKITVADYTFNGANEVTLQNQGSGSQGIALGAQGGQQLVGDAASRPRAQATNTTNAGTINLITTGNVTQTPSPSGGITANNVNILAGPQSTIDLSNPNNQIGNLLIVGGSSSNVVAPGATTPASGMVSAYNASNGTFSTTSVGNSAPAPAVAPVIASSRASVQSAEVINETRTDVYVRGQISRPQVCTPASTAGGAIALAEVDPLANQWIQVRRSAQLSTCSSVRNDSSCSAF